MFSYFVKNSIRVALLLWIVCSSCKGEQDALNVGPKHFKMEKHIPRTTFVERGRASTSDVHELVFAIKQRNIDVLERKLVESSTPGSPHYLQWMTNEEVGKLCANHEATHQVTTWLESNGATVVSKSVHGEYITATASINKWESLLDTEFFEWEDLTFQEGEEKLKKQRRVVHRAKEYSIPVELKDHLTSVFNTVQTPPPYKAKYHRPRKVPFKSNLRMRPTAAGDVTVEFLDELYRINSNIGSSELSQSVFETNNEKYSQNDLTEFQQTYGLAQQDAVDQNNALTTNCATNSCTEGNLDIQYIMGVAQETVSIFWYVSSGTGTDPFVLWITAVSAEADPPKSNSISWGSVESLVSSSVMEAFQTEAIKLANQGVTITVSSGDDGAANGYDVCLCSGVSDSGIDSDGYNPSFPASCPYVTAVGATMGPETGDAEKVCQSDNGGIITSGGGFSDHFTALDWQTDAMDAYFNSLDANPVSGYNRNGRGIPDISLIGVNYQVVIQGSLASVYGTSCSAPVLAAMVSLVNAARLNASLGSIGFLNPTLYSVGMNASSPFSFNDVTAGDNKCCAQDNNGDVDCCSTGFVAAAGWDPITGWGSINFDTFSAMYDVATPYTIKTKDDNSSGVKLWYIIIAIVIGILLLCGLMSLFSCLCGGGSRGQEHHTVVYRDNGDAVQMTPVYVQHN